MPGGQPSDVAGFAPGFITYQAGTDEVRGAADLPDPRASRRLASRRIARARENR